MSNEQYFYDAFVSHASADADRVAEIVAALEARGLKLWVAPRDIDPGTDYSDQIIAGLNSSRSLLALLSENALASRHVRSEVERASNAGKALYPVKIEDVEIRGGLEFFLSLSQRIDLSQEAEKEALDRLAAAIKEAKPPKPGGKSLLKSRPLRTAGVVVVAAALVVMATIFIQDQIETAREAAEIARLEAEYAEDRLRRAAERREQELERFRQAGLRTGFNVVDRKLTMTVSTSRRLPEGSALFYSVEGSEFAPLAGPITIADWTARRVSVELRAGDEVLSSFDLSEDVTAFHDQNLSPRGSRFDEDRNGCNGFRCTLETLPTGGSLCYPLVKSVSAVVGGQTHPFDLSGCSSAASLQEISHRPYGEAVCLSAADMGAPLRPGEAYQLRTELLTGEALTYDGVVGLTRPLGEVFFRQRDLDKWTFVEGVPVDGPPDGFAPLLGVRYEPPSAVVGSFVLTVFVTPCGPGRNFGFAIDADGRGFLDYQRRGHSAEGVSQTFYFSPGDRQSPDHPLPTEPRDILIALKENGRVTYGPYRYAFDPGDVIMKTAKLDIEPRLKCENRFRRRHCVAERRLAWFDVKEIRIGRDQTVSDAVLPVDFTVGRYIAESCNVYESRCAPILYEPEVPPGGEFFYQVVMADGSEFAVVRQLAP